MKDSRRISPLRIFGVSFVMIAAAVFGRFLQPTHLQVDRAHEVNLESLIPKQFGGWKDIPQVGANQVGTTVPGEDEVKVIYDQTVMRTYRGPHGELVMLAAAYGARQNDELKVHRPEVCYTAQGFQVLDKQLGNLSFGNGLIPVTRLVARNEQRVEPITYWIRVGDQIVRGGMKQKVEIIRAGLMGNVLDGLLIRVSSIEGSDSAAAYANAFSVQGKFLNDLLGAVSRDQRGFLIGNKTVGNSAS